MAVSPADGKVVAVKPESAGADPHQHLPQYLRRAREPRAHRREPSPRCSYQQGKFQVASREDCSAQNEQNVVTVQGDGTTRGLQADRRPDRAPHRLHKKPGDHVATGERVGLIKFGSRVDVLFGPEWEIVVQPGMRVSAGSSVIARREPPHGATAVGA